MAADQQPAAGGDRPGAARTPSHRGDEAPAGAPGSGEDVCPACGGSGRLQGSACAECGGSGKVVRGIGGG